MDWLDRAGLKCDLHVMYLYVLFYATKPLVMLSCVWKREGGAPDSAVRLDVTNTMCRVGGGVSTAWICGAVLLSHAHT